MMQYRGMMKKWVASVQKGMKEYNDLVYNAYTMMKDYYSYEDLLWMPLKHIMRVINEFKPRFQEIARRQQQEAQKQALEGKKRAAAARAQQGKGKNGKAPSPRDESWRKNYRM